MHALYSMFLLLLLSMFTPRATTVDVNLAQAVLKDSVLIRVKQYTVNPRTKEVSRGMVGCSGTLISSNTILTAAHCLSNPSTEIFVRQYGSVKSYKAVPLKIDATTDLALLQVRKLKAKHFAKLGDYPKAGQQVIAVGSPFMFEFLLSDGIVSAVSFKTKEFASTYIVHTAMINSGSSGGGLFDSKGHLIGVNTMTVGFFGWAGISMTVDIATVREFLKPAARAPFIEIIIGN